MNWIDDSVSVPRLTEHIRFRQLRLRVTKDPILMEPLTTALTLDVRVSDQRAECLARHEHFLVLPLWLASKVLENVFLTLDANLQ